MNARLPLDSIRFPDREAYGVVRRKGRRARSGELEMRWLEPAPDSAFRMAVVLSRKNGSAPLRNRIKRQLRELIRLERTGLKSVWIVWTFPRARLSSKPRDLRTAARQLLQGAGILAP